MPSEEFHRNPSLLNIISQYCCNYWRALSKDHKLCSVCLVKQQHCRCFFESFGPVKFKTNCKIKKNFILSQWWAELGRFPIQLLLRSCERYDISQTTENRNAERTWVPRHDHAWPHSLFRFRWRRRLVVISAPSDEDWAYSQQLAALSGQACNFGE